MCNYIWIVMFGVMSHAIEFKLQMTISKPKIFTRSCCHEGLKLYIYIYISIMLLLLFSIYESCTWICFSPKNGHRLKRNSNIFQFNLHF